MRTIASSLRRTVLVAALLLSSVSVSALRAQPSAQQVIPLSVGWNLISIQIAGVITPDAFRASLQHPDRLAEIWSYTPSGNPSVPGTWNVFTPGTLPAGYPNDLTALEPGRGYWVRIATGATTAVLNGPRWDGAVSLLAGWNLVGFPGLDLAQDEMQDLTSVFGGNLARIQQVWTHEAGANRFVGYDLTAIPALRDLNQIRPGSGYWVYALEPVLVEAGPYVILPGDADASPLEPEVDFNPAHFPSLPNPSEYAGTLIRKVRPGSEDVALDLNANGIIDSIFTQSHLKFDIGVDRKVITIGNRGTGLANWVLSNSVNWLFTAPPDAKRYPGNAGRPKTASGVVSADRDTVTLYADTTGLEPGSHVGTITIHAGSLVKTITVKLDVPTSSGDWKGYATTERVNGKSIPLGAVDLGINLFMDSENPSERSFRAILNKDTSLLFPRDVFMNGVFYSGNDFSFTTNFEMPAGDRNAPKYETFQRPSNYDALTGIDKVKADYDANSDGKVDVSNPFPFPVRRQITLLGRRPSPDRLEGTYIESITGVLPNNQPILVEGTFSLARQTLSPSKRSIFNQTTANAPIVIGSTGGLLYRETTLTVGSAVVVQGLTLNLNVTFPDPTKLVITLIGPTGLQVPVHLNGTTLPTSIDLTAFNGLLGGGTWKLRVAWAPTAERGQFNSWSLNVQGLATYTVSGRVRGDTDGNATTEPIAGATVILSGSNVLKQATTAADGSFSITGLTENTYTLSFSRPGFQDRLISFFLNNSNLYIAHKNGVGEATANAGVLTSDPVILTPLAITAPELRAAPWIGQEDLFVRFAPLVPQSSLAAIGGTIASATWNFGGADIASEADPLDEVGITSASHTFEDPGTYTVRVSLQGTSGSPLLLEQTVHVQRASPDTRPDAGDHQLIALGFAGAFAAPLNNGNVIEVSAPATTNQTINVRQADSSMQETTLSSVPVATVRQESKRDVASFDIDREPLIPSGRPFSPAAEDSDFVDALYVSGDGSPTLPFAARGFDPGQDPPGDNSPGTFAAYNSPVFQGRPVPERFRCFVTLGGSTFATQALKVGNLELQVGRIEP